MTTPTWMIDGKPGQILGLLVEAAAKSGVVEQKNAKAVGDHYDIGALERAARVFSTMGLAVTAEFGDEWVGSPQVSEKGTASFPAHICCTLTVIAADGSYVVASAVGAATAHGGRHLSQARTDARKECLRVLLQVATTENDEAQRQAALDQAAAEEEARRKWSPALRTFTAEIERCSTYDELAVVNKHDSFLDLDPNERAISRIVWARRKEDLRSLAAAEYGQNVGRRPR